MKRRDFIWQSGASMLAFTLIGKNNYAFAADNKTTGACIPTTSDILGPYYRQGAPFRSDLTVAGQAGTILHYKGKVLNENCNPISNAMVDVWQADSDGAYDNSTAAFNYRGRFQTGADGAYEFTAVKPGWYLNGSQYRPAHIHFRVTKPGYTELITQLYFQNDPYIPIDPWASDPDAQMRIVPINDVAGVNTAVFDITLAGNTTGIDKVQNESPVVIAGNPFKDCVQLTTKSAQIKNIETFDINGRLVARAYDINAGSYKLSLNFLGAGLYFCRVETDKGIFVHKLIKE